VDADGGREMSDFQIRLLLSGVVLGLTLFIFSWSPELDGYHRLDHRWSLRASGVALFLASLALLVIRP